MEVWMDGETAGCRECSREVRGRVQRTVPLVIDMLIITLVYLLC